MPYHTKEELGGNLQTGNELLEMSTLILRCLYIRFYISHRLDRHDILFFYNNLNKPSTDFSLWLKYNTIKDSIRV
jgi:hypothetical protein